MTEVVVVARHQMDGVVPAHQNVGDEVVPRGGHHLVVKGDHQHLPDAKEPLDQVLAGPRGS